jgi:hypothetical protein
VPYELGLAVLFLIPVRRRLRRVGMWVSLVWIRGCVGVTFVDFQGRMGDD